VRRGAAARCAAVALGALVALAWWTAAASAHANLRSSSPASGAALQSAPAEVTLTFTEPPEPSLAQIHVLDTAGTPFEHGAAGPVAGDPDTLRVAVKPLPRGVYTVTWRVVSRADGHATAGAFAFGVGTSPAGVTTTVPPPRAPGPNPVEIAGRLVFIAGIFVALGGSAVAFTVFGDERVRLFAYVLAGAAVALAGVVVLGYGQQRAAGAGLAAILRTPIGQALEWRAAFVVAALAAALVRRRAAMPAVALLSVAAVYAEVDAGHASAVAQRWVSVAAQSAHFTAAAVWIGGLGALFLGLRGEPSDRRSVVGRFSTLAAVAIAVVAGTGAYRAVVEVGRWSALWGSSYGIVVLVKTALLGVLALLGARNRYTNVPAAAADLRGFRRTTRFELGTAAVVVVATALLAGLSPPPPLAVAEATAPLSASGSDLGHLYRVRLEIVPGYAGPNTFRAHVDDYASRRPAKVGIVSLRFEFADGTVVGPSTLPLRESKGDLWTADGTNLSLDGRWTITAVVQGAATSAEVPLHVTTRCRTQVLSAGPPTIFTEQLADGATAQTYVDPGKPGYDEVHFTFFDAKGNELPIPANPSITASKNGGPPSPLGVRRFSAGHFIASGTLRAGRWRFESQAAAAGSAQPLRACFEQTIGT
jgi:copper transport protein